MIKLLVVTMLLLPWINLRSEELKTMTVKEYYEVVEQPYESIDLSQYEIKKPKVEEERRAVFAAIM